MVDYLLDWLHNLLVTLATLAGIGLLAYAAMREFSPAWFLTMQQSFKAAAQWISGANIWPILPVILAMIVLGTTLPHRESRI